MSLAHQALLYGSRDEFVATIAPFVRAGLERGDTVFVATKQPNVEALSEELGDDRGRLELHDSDEWCTRPYDRLQAFRRLAEATAHSGALRAAGEPVWNASEAATRQWARYESVVNVALADSPGRLLCLYDGAVLPDEILEYALRTHPERLQDGSVIPSEEFVPPGEFVPGLPPAPPPAAPELPVDGAALRREVAARALRAGLPRQHAEGFVLAANEVATNAHTHGRPPVRAHMWTQGEELICQIADAGSGVADPLAGWIPPVSAAHGGWGLSMARRLCDGVEIVTREEGTIVSLHLSLPR